MDIQRSVDFETFYFLRLLETIMEQGKSTLDGSLNQSLNTFLNFLSSGATPIENIEKLAQLQGTSDVSIYFSDLLERIKQYSPDKAVEQMNEYATDFIEIFKELSKDLSWNQNISQELMGLTSAQEEFSLKEFVSLQAKEQVLSQFDRNKPALERDVIALFNRIGNGESLPKIFSNYKKNNDLQNSIDLFNEIYQVPHDSISLEKYFQNFSQNINKLSIELDRLSGENEAVFNAFCDGRQIPAGPEAAESELDEIIESVEQKEGTAEDTTQITPEDKNLRWLLRDYLVHEIDELSKEVTLKLEKLIASPNDQEAESIVIDNLKVLKDLGQIHKYMAIEKISGELLSNLKAFFHSSESIPSLTVDLVHDILGNFTKYINAVLEEDESDILNSLEENKKHLFEVLHPTQTTDELIGFDDQEKIQSIFEEVNILFIEKIREDYNSLLNNPDDDQIKEFLIHNLEHCKVWYGLLKLSGGADVLEVLLSWLRNPKQHEKLMRKQGEIFNSFDTLSKQLLTNSPEKWTEYIEKLIIGVSPKEAVDISNALKAFKDVAKRGFSFVKNDCQDDSINLDTILNESLNNQLNQLVNNSILIKNNELKLLGEFLLDIQSELLSVSKEKEVEIRGTLADILTQVMDLISNLPSEIKIEQVKQDIREKFQGIIELPTLTSEEMYKTEGELGTTEDVTIERELKDTFYNEINQYLDEMKECIKHLSDNMLDVDKLRELNNVIHTLKSSAQMMNRQEVRSLLDPLEHLVELIVGKKINLTTQFISLSSKVVNSIRRQLKGKQIDLNELTDAIEDYISKNSSEIEFTEDTKKKPEKDFISPPQDLKKPHEEIEPAIEKVSEDIQKKDAEIPEEHEQLLKLEEKDPELIEIFRNEASDNLDSIEKNLTLIEKFHHDKQTLQSLDHSVHEIRSAAKMLGFSEIGALVDRLEELIELVSKKEFENIKEMIPSFRQVIHIITELAENQEVSQSKYYDAETAISQFLTMFKEDTDKLPAKEPEMLVDQQEQKQAEVTDLMIQSFIQESREFLEDLNFILMKLEKDPDDQDLVYRLMRTFHTLKGSASMINQESIEKLTHLSEEVVEKYRKSKESLSGKVCDLFFEVIDEIDFIISALASEEKEKFKNFDEIKEKLESELSGDKKKGKRKRTVKQKSRKADESAESYFSITDKVESKEPRDIDAHVRLRVEQIDNLLNEAAELVINHNQFKTQIDKYKGYLPRMDTEGKNLQNILWHFDKIVKEQQQLMDLIKTHGKNLPVVKESQKNQIESIQRATSNLQKFFHNFSVTLQGLKDSGRIYDEQLQKIIRLSNQMHEEIVKARLVPIKILFTRFHRPLRDLAKKMGKKIKLYLNGENTELDRILAEKLYEPVLHILRNAIDHGIELPKERKKARKPEEGLIKLTASQERNFITITIEDDGKGIDVDQIRSKAIKLGYLKEKQARELTDQEIFEFLLYSGFSTSKETTTISGRGFGLDVVRNQIQKIKGDLRIYSVPGKGARFVIRLPISLTVIQAIIVEVNKNTYAIPLLQVEETTNINPSDLKLKKKNYYIHHRGYEIPVINLSSLLIIQHEEAVSISRDAEYPIIIIQDEGKKIGLLVDKVLQREEILIKSLGHLLDRVRYVLGGSILVDGKVILVLDVPQIVFYSLRLKESTLKLEPEVSLKKDTTELKDEKITKQKKRLIKDRKPLILVVDDSLSVRKFLSGLLTKHKFSADVAKNGDAALEKLNEHEFDLIITDLEMPHLSGYELIEQIRSDPRWESLPIIVLTGRASKHIEDHALKLGADEFIIKPFKESDLIDKIKNFISINI